MKQHKETLWIKLTAGAVNGEAVPWARLDAAGRVVARGLDGLAELPDAPVCKAVLAADRVWCARLRPPGRRRLRGAALAYALEERLADAPEAVHAVAGPLDREGGCAVAVVERDWFAAVLAALAAAGRAPVSVLPEPALCHASQEEWRLIRSQPSFLLAGPETVLTLPDDAAACRDWLALALARASVRPQRLVVEGGAADDVGLDGVECVAGASYDWVLAAAGGGGPDLLEGEFGLRPGFRIEASAWRPAAWLLLALVSVNGLGFLLSDALKAWEARRLAQANRTLFSATFPEAKVVVDPLRQMRGKVAELRHKAGAESDGDLLPMLSRVGRVLPASARMAARGLQYRPGTLILRLPSGQALPEGWGAAGLKASRRPSAEPGWDELTVEIAS